MSPALQRGSDAGAPSGVDHEVRLASRHAREDVERAMSLLAPFIERTIDDQHVSHDRALVIAVVDPAAPPGTAFDDAVLSTHAFGRAGTCDVDYSRYALDKARTSHRERADTSLLRERGSALLTADLPLVGGLHRRGWTLGVSGAIPAYDEAIGGIVIELLVALGSHRAARAVGESRKESGSHDA